MHRSGTSLVTNLVHEFGFDFGGPHLEPQPDNPRGFWENREIVRIHDDFLHRLGRSWSDPRPFRPDEFDGKAANWARERLREVLSRDFLSRSRWVFKDPRTCRLGPLWGPILSIEGVDPGFLIVVRTPIAVARSLAQRQGFSVQKSLLLWLRHYLEAEAWTRERCRSWVLFEEACKDPLGSIERALRPFEFGFDTNGAPAAKTLESVIDPSLIHHEGDTTLDGESWTSLPWVDSLWEALQLLAREESDEAYGQIDAIKAAIGVADELMMSDPIVWEIESLRERAEDLRFIMEETRQLVGEVYSRDSGSEELLTELRSVMTSTTKSGTSLRKAWKNTEKLLIRDRDLNSKARSDVETISNALGKLSQELVSGENSLFHVLQRVEDQNLQISRLQETSDHVVEVALSTVDQVKENIAKTEKLKSSQTQVETKTRGALRRLKQDIVDGNAAILEELQQTAVTVGGEYERHDGALQRIATSQSRFEAEIDAKLKGLRGDVKSGEKRTVNAIEGVVVDRVQREIEKIAAIVGDRDELQLKYSTASQSVERLREERDVLAEERKRALSEIEALTKEIGTVLEDRDVLIVERDRVLEDRNAVAAAAGQIERRLKDAAEEVGRLRAERDLATDRLGVILESRIWRVSAPVRAVLDRLKGR